MEEKVPPDIPSAKDVSMDDYAFLPHGIVDLLDEARRQAARSINAILTATYWEIGRRIVEFEQGGKQRAEYGEALLLRLSSDLTGRFGRGFSERNLQQMRQFYLGWRIPQTLSAESDLSHLAQHFPLTWSHYIRLLAVKTSLCSQRDAAVARYALGNLRNQVLAAEYRLTLPEPEQLEAEVEKTRKMLLASNRRDVDAE